MRPRAALSSITEQVHDNRALIDSLVNLKKICARDPSVPDGLLPTGTIFSHTNDDIEPVVAKIEALPVTLRAVADERERIVLEVVLELVVSCQPLAQALEELTYQELVTGPVIALCFWSVPIAHHVKYSLHIP